MIVFCDIMIQIISKGGNRMIKNVGIVSLSSGIIGESFVRHEVDLGLKRLKDLGLEVTFLEYAQKGMDYWWR